MVQKKRRFDVRKCKVEANMAWILADQHFGLPVSLYRTRQEAEKHRNNLTSMSTAQVESVRLWRRSALRLRRLYEEAKWGTNQDETKAITGLEPIPLKVRYTEMHCDFGGVVELQLKALLRLEGQSHDEARRAGHQLGHLLAAADRRGCGIEREYSRWGNAFDRECAEENRKGKSFDAPSSVVWGTANEVAQNLSGWRDRWYWGEEAGEENFPGEGALITFILLAHVLDHLLLKRHILTVHDPAMYGSLKLRLLCDEPENRQLGEAVLGLIRPWWDRTKLWNPMWGYSTISDWWRKRSE